MSMARTADNDIFVGGIYNFTPIESERYYPGIVEVIKDDYERFTVNVIDGVRKGGGIIYVMKGSRFHKWMSLMDDPKHDNTAENNYTLSFDDVFYGEEHSEKCN